MIGKTLALSRAGAIWPPSEMDWRAASMALATTWLPEVSRTISNEVSTGTPERVKAPKVRQKRATADFWIRSPKMGSLRASASMVSLPAGVR